MSESAADPAIEDLSLRVLHGLADDDERAELARLLAKDSANRRCFLDITLLHGMLAREAQAGAFADNKDEFFRRIEEIPVRRPKRFLKVWLPAAAAVIVALLVTVALLPINAGAALNRVVDAMNRDSDRCYHIVVVEAGSESGVSTAGRGRFPIGKSLDGSTLWLRGRDEFVMRQSLPNGETRTLGGNAKESWTMRGDGPLRVSDDTHRFGNSIFGKNGEFAYLDLRTQLDDLKRLYQIEWLDRTSSATWKIRGVRRTHNQGGPREIELWFSPETGLLGRMILRHMPRENGGPRSIAIILDSTELLPPDFFQHTRHLKPGQTIIREP